MKIEFCCWEMGKAFKGNIEITFDNEGKSWIIMNDHDISYCPWCGSKLNITVKEKDNENQTTDN